MIRIGHLVFSLNLPVRFVRKCFQRAQSVPNRMVQEGTERP